MRIGEEKTIRTRTSFMDCLSVYRELADCYDRLGQASMRDRFLILAADAALQSGQAGEAERLRLRLLQGSRHHMLRPYHSFAEAVRAADVQTYLQDLRRNYPEDVARQLLDSVQGTTAPPAAMVEQTQTADWSPEETPADRPARHIPPTAPLLEITGPAPGNLAGEFPREPRVVGGAAGNPMGRSTPAAETYPLRVEPAARPLAQPIAGRVPVARPINSTRPLTRIPDAQPQQANPPRAIPPLSNRREASYPLAPLSTLPQMQAEPETPTGGGAWFSMLLVGVVGMVALALVVFTLARPFLPAEWFR
jgi:hypothetical protein